MLVRQISRGHSVIAFCSQSLLGVALSLWGAPMCAWLAESFDPVARLTSVAVGYNVAQAIAGGSMPFLATLVVDKMGPETPGYLLSFLAIVALMGLWIVSPSVPVNRNLVVATRSEFSSLSNVTTISNDSVASSCELVETVV
jgi:MFS transporter, MHS family, proline/betaine transporter